MARSKLSPRKTPVQERSQATVDAILQAAADILSREGAARLTTNRIAERAGVNIASLYQYFPGKDAIVAELRRRHVTEQRDAARDALAGLRGKGVEDTIRTLVTMGIAAHAVAPKLHRALVEELPARRSRIADKDDPVMTDARQILASMVSDLPDPELALWMIDTVAYAVIHRATVERPGDLSGGVLAEELTTMLRRYVRRR
jgi:AcrR family transcriptional regulator